MTGDDIVCAARSWVGTPYLHQASVKGAGCDCLGLLRGVWREFWGSEPAKVPAYTPDWDEVAREDILERAACRLLILRADNVPCAGDVLLFRMRSGAVAKHVGIYTGGARFIHAYSGHGVVESALTDAWRRRIAGVFVFPGVGPGSH